MARSSGSTLPWVLFGTVAAGGIGYLAYNLLGLGRKYSSAVEVSTALDKLVSDYRMGYKSPPEAMKEMLSLTHEVEPFVVAGSAGADVALAVVAKMGVFAEQLRQLKTAGRFTPAA